MLNGRRSIAIIPARGGSKGLPNKNIRDLHGKPLLAWSIEQALACDEIDTVVVTTDSPEIREIALAYGAEAPFLRPPELSTDEATSADTVKHVLDYYRDQFSKSYDILCLLQPTSPLRCKGDLSKMLTKMVEGNYRGMVSLGEVAHHPYIMKRLDGDRFLKFVETPFSELRRQDLPEAYFPFNIAFMVSIQAFLEEHSFYVKDSGYFLAQPYQCYEIDTLFDFICMEAMMGYMLSQGLL